MDSCVRRSEMYFVFLNYDPRNTIAFDPIGVNESACEALLKTLYRNGVCELDMYVSNKPDDLLAGILEPGSYKKTLSLVIVDGFTMEVSEDQATLLRSVKGVRVVEKNQEVV